MRKVNVGIDLGTTYSAVAVFDKASGTTQILKNGDGASFTPSVVCFEGKNIYIGEDAKSMQAAGNVNTMAFYKNMMGDDSYYVEFNGKKYTSEDLSREYLKVLIKDIEETNDVKIEGAVITCPAYFDEKQRNATLNAGKGAGLKVLKIINEPTAAIISYGLTGGASKTVMVYDLGGGTFDVTVARITGSKVDVIATNGNHQLGGKNWDSVIYDMLKKKFYDDYGIDVDDYPEVSRELAVKSENVKKGLTARASVSETISCEGYTATYEITRQDFDFETESLLNETVLLINKCFTEIGNGFGWKDLDEVVLVGGSTRMPQVKNFVISAYGKEPITKDINVDTIVASGAAIQAELCTSMTLTMRKTVMDETTKTNKVVNLLVKNTDIEDITAHSLGMLALKANNDEEFVNSIILKKNSKVNVAQGKDYRFKGKNLEVYVLQGESNDPYDCKLLYKFSITGMNPSAEEQIKVNFLYNSSGMVEVTASSSGRNLSVAKETVTETIDELIERLIEERKKAIAPKTTEINFMIDVSGSMSGEPIEEAQKALHDFVDEIGGAAKIGILAFSDSSKWMCKRESDPGKVHKAINSITACCTGICNEETPLSRRGDDFGSCDKKVIVVLTDGCWENQSSEVRAASKLKSKEITIFAIGFGSADKSFLDQISTTKGAKIDLSNLRSTFSELANTIATEVIGGNSLR